MSNKVKSDLIYQFSEAMILEHLKRAQDQELLGNYTNALRHLRTAIRNLDSNDQEALSVELGQIENYIEQQNTITAFPGKIQLWGENHRIRSQYEQTEGYKLYSSIQEKINEIVYNKDYFKVRTYQFYDPSKGRPSP